MHVHNNIAFEARYGDYFIWCQIIDFTRKNDKKHILFITDDEKEDWWQIIEFQGRKTIGPRPELIDELSSVANVHTFHMYNSERLIKYAAEQLHLPIKPVSAQQVRDVKESGSAWEGVQVEEAVRRWLVEEYGPGSVTADRACDFVVTTDDGTNVGYDIYKVRNRNQAEAIAARRIRQIGEKKSILDVDRFKLVFVCESETQAFSANRLFMRIMKNAWPGIGLVTGYIDRDSMKFYVTSTINR